MELVCNPKYTISDLVEIVRILRSPDGCPWDRMQTHSSIRSNLIEEAYEAIESIDLSDDEMLKEKLGDLLLQVVFHCSIEDEESKFGLDDVVDGVCQRMILRHPHVFSNSNYSKDKKGHIYNMYEFKNKNIEKFKFNGLVVDSPEDSLKDISKVLPSLMRTEKVQGRIARSGYGLFSVEDALNECFEKLHCLETLIMEGSRDDYESQLGDLLFSVTEVARLIGIDAESALYDSCERFKDQFLYKISLENRNKV